MLQFCSSPILLTCWCQVSCNLAHLSVSSCPLISFCCARCFQFKTHLCQHSFLLAESGEGPACMAHVPRCATSSSEKQQARRERQPANSDQQHPGSAAPTPPAQSTMSSCGMQVCAVQFEGGPSLFRPCVDCGLHTGNFCDGQLFIPVGSSAQTGPLMQSHPCYAATRLPKEEWNEGQFTPLCTSCERSRGSCHFCRGQSWCTPESRGASAVSVTPDSST